MLMFDRITRITEDGGNFDKGYIEAELDVGEAGIAEHLFHRLLGLDENKLLRASRGLFSLGQRFSNWSGGDSAFLHAYDTQGISLSHVDFYQYWLKARAQGLDEGDLSTLAD